MKFKYHLLILCLIFLGKVYTASAQKIHFSDTSNKWMTYFYNSQGASNGQQVYYRYSYLDSAVNENGHTYSVLNNSGQGQILIREEGNKIYIKPLATYFGGFIVTDPGEFLYFDYDLQVGDTFQMPLVGQTYPVSVSVHEVLSIDSITINNVWHKVFRMNVVSGFAGTYIFTEGLGTQQGPIVVPYSPAYQANLICFQNNGTTPLPNLSNCSELNAIDEVDVIASFFKIAPNPTTDNVFISYTGQTKTDFELNVMDILGRSMMHSQFSKDIKIDVSALQSGLYLIQFLHKGKLMKTDKLIVSK
jgi:hypothetical protein